MPPKEFYDNFEGIKRWNIWEDFENLPSAVKSRRAIASRVVETGGKVMAQENGPRENFVDASIPLYKNPVLLVVLMCATVVAVLSIGGLVIYRRKMKMKKHFDEFVKDDGRRRSRVNSKIQADIAMYGGADPNRPIEFVVPNIMASYSNLPSPGGDTASLSSASSADGQMWMKLMLLDNVSLNSQSLSLLGGLNPDLYKLETEEIEDTEIEYPDNHRGRLWFAMEYDSSAERLVVRLIKAKNLPSRVLGCSNSCDPFVRLYLMPDERRYLQSRQKKKTCNPKFEETFIFQVPVKMLQERSLKLSVFDNDRGKRHNVIGHALLHLKDLDVNSTSSMVHWRDLEKDVDEVSANLGELYLSLCYNQNLERLTVSVFEARGLRLTERSENIDTFVKVTFLLENRPVKTKKTALAKKTYEPKYNESFHFRLTTASLDTASVILQVMAPGTGLNKEKCFGRVVLGSFMFARGKALEHWNEATASSSVGQKQIRHWHNLT